MLATTAAFFGAKLINYVEVNELIKENGKVVGVVCKDNKGNEKFEIKAKGVINATGPFSDHILKMDSPNHP